MVASLEPRHCHRLREPPRPGFLMKTLLLAPELFSAGGGIPRILRLYLRALCELSGSGDSVRLIALNDAVIDSSDLRRYASSRLTGWEACNRHKGRFIRAAFRAARGSDFVVCGHVAQLPVAWVAKRLNRRLRYTCIAHGIEVWRRFSFLERLALRGADQVWCVSEFTRRQLLDHSSLQAEKAIILPNALDPHFETAPSSPSLKPVILTVSRLSRADNYKGIDHLIEAMPMIRKQLPEASLHIVGRGDDLPRLQTLAAARHLNGAVKFLGYLDDPEMKQELSACRLFALPSQKEGFGLVYLEAMAHGKPCLGAAAGGTPEVISPEAGLLASYGRPDEIAAACVEGLQRNWDATAIVARAEMFSYARFRDRLRPLIFS
jgi:glycosyltransferase involved in cell wall biosynthesis